MKRNTYKYLSAFLVLLILGAYFVLVFARTTDPLPSWNEGPAKKAIIQFISATTDKNNPSFVPIEERIATFDQDGTLWVEKPTYIQLTYSLDRIKNILEQNPELKETEPFKTIIAKKDETLTKLPSSDLEKIAMAALTGMSVEQFQQEVHEWIKTAKDTRWNSLHTELTYQPMLEVLIFFRANGYKTYIVTGGNQDFVRTYSQETFGIPPEQVVGSAVEVSYEYEKSGQPFLKREPKVLLNNNGTGKPKGIHFIIGRRPYAAFGNSTGDREMLEYTHFGEGQRLAMLILHDDPIREYAYGPAQGLPESRVGTFTQALYDEAKEKGWVVVSMKNDWNRIFSFEDLSLSK